jgi:DNA-binding MarR family transcriptional regulator
MSERARGPRQLPKRTVEDDLGELHSLLPQLFRGLRLNDQSLREIEPLKRAFVEAGLGDRHRRVLATLALSGPLTVSQLAERIALAPATTSLLVGELDRAGFVERREDDADRRRTIVSLPDQLQKTVGRLAKVRIEPLRRTLERLEPEARAHFIEGLRVLTAEVRGAGD